MACLLASFGAGFAALGFGGSQVEQGAGLLALALAICLLLFKGSVEPLRVMAAPAVIFSLCYAGVAGAGNAFAFFLMGCGCLVIWLFLKHRFEQESAIQTNVNEVARRLVFIATFAGIGMAAGCCFFQAWDMAAQQEMYTLIAAIALAGMLYQMTELSEGQRCQTRHEEILGSSECAEAMKPREDARNCPAPSADELERLFALSPREAQVAHLVCQNRSVQYISQTLGMAESTTKTHVRHVYEKADVHSRSELQLEAERLSRLRLEHGPE